MGSPSSLGARDLFEHMAHVRSHEAIEREQRATDMRIVVEVTSCAHESVIVHDAIGGPFDDHYTEYGCCRSCGQWVCVTTSLVRAGRDEMRLMTPKEIDRLQTAEDDYRRADAS